MNQRIKELAEQASVNDPPYNQFVESFAQLVAEDCAKIARVYTLKHCGVSEDYTGEVLVEKEILNRFSSQPSEFVRMKENVA